MSSAGQVRPAVDDVGAVGVADEQIDGELDDRVGVHQLPGMGAADEENARAGRRPHRAHPQRVDGRPSTEALGQLNAREVLREPRGEQAGQPSRAGRSCGTSASPPALDGARLLLEPRLDALVVHHQLGIERLDRQRPQEAGPRSPARPVRAASSAVMSSRTSAVGVGDPVEVEIRHPPKRQVALAREDLRLEAHCLPVCHHGLLDRARRPWSTPGRQASARRYLARAGACVTVVTQWPPSAASRLRDVGSASVPRHRSRGRVAAPSARRRRGREPAGSEA